MATYPNDASWSAENVFSIINSVTYSNTSINTSFNLGVYASTLGEVFAIADGVLQVTSSYSLSNGGGTVTFASAPNASNLTLRTLNIPNNFKQIAVVDQFYSINYTNSSFTTINGNNYILNGVDREFAIPENINPNSKNELFVIIDGVIQSDSQYTWPSGNLSVDGIEITSDLSNNNLEIRVFSPSNEIVDRKNNMSDRKPDRGSISEEKEYSVETFTSRTGYESRRLISRRPIRSWEFQYTNLSGIEKEAIMDFYDSRSGVFEKFIFDLTHINDSGTATVRFDRPIQSTLQHSTGTSIYNNYYDISIRLKEVFR